MGVLRGVKRGCGALIASVNVKAGPFSAVILCDSNAVAEGKVMEHAVNNPGACQLEVQVFEDCRTAAVKMVGYNDINSAVVVHVVVLTGNGNRSGMLGRIESGKMVDFSDQHDRAAFIAESIVRIFKRGQCFFRRTSVSDCIFLDIDNFFLRCTGGKNKSRDKG